MSPRKRRRLKRLRPRRRKRSWVCILRTLTAPRFGLGWARTVVTEDAMIATTKRVYDAFGRGWPQPSGHSLSGYAAERFDDALAGYLLGDRPYFPALRRFGGPDPTSPFGAGGCNRYAYCAGDPVNRVDPTGRAWVGWLKHVFTSAAAAWGARIVEHVVFPAAAAVMTTGAAVIDGLKGAATTFSGRFASPGAFDDAMLSGRRSAPPPRVRLMEDSVSLSRGLKRVTYGAADLWSVNVLYGAGLRDLPDLVGRILPDGKDFRVSPATVRWQNAKGGSVVGFDTTVNWKEITNTVDRLADAEPDRAINVFVGTHGSSSGNNWAKANGKQGRWMESDFASGESHALVNGRYRASERITVLDARTYSALQFKKTIRNDPDVNLLGWCFSAADSAANEVRSALQPGGSIAYTMYARRA
ncbi:RHS repeat-associated core domain-containing protein [Luteibacter sahnii]|uniref:RHS repeat-associated core domain-containing protein n=1 Tax=Luteibacter sahnii TaxID=3021977 RepID=UPI002A6A2A0D|nr:RHS repeat-associated core domain-containing protein [Luteibacter sp. PPL193]MDY1547280.1 hypothetical protein [Luteibacter sp. PPL193]